MTALARSGQLVTADMLRPPLPDDNAVLYFRPENSPIASLGRSVATQLRDPSRGEWLRIALARAMLVPALALLLVIATVVGTAATRMRAPDPEREPAEPDLR